MGILIKNGRILDPANRRDEVADIYIENGVIAGIGKLDIEGTEIIDAKGCWVTPGFIDMHVHLREPGGTHKETIATGTRAAAAGGFTTICCMPNTDPVIDSEILVEYIKLKAEREGVVNVLPIGSVTKGMQGLELSGIGKMAEAGICAVSEDGKTVENTKLLQTAMKYAGMFNLPMLSHCEDKQLVGGGQIHAGLQAEVMGLAGISAASEEVIVARDIVLANSVKAKLHICHVSAEGSVRQVRDAKARGEAVTAEVTPHHFTLVDEDIVSYDTNFKMAPPLRGVKDREAVLNGLKDGTIEVIATDHASHHEDEKNVEFANAPNGIIGLETAVPLAITELVEKGVLTPMQLIEKMSYNPAKILGINKGTLSVNAAADITIIDPSAEYAIDKNSFKSKSKNTPFDGRVVRGKVIKTIVSGKVVEL